MTDELHQISAMLSGAPHNGAYRSAWCQNGCVFAGRRALAQSMLSIRGHDFSRAGVYERGFPSGDRIGHGDRAWWSTGARGLGLLLLR